MPLALKRRVLPNSVQCDKQGAVGDVGDSHGNHDIFMNLEPEQEIRERWLHGRGGGNMLSRESDYRSEGHVVGT